MRIMVTGVSGQVGGALVKALEWIGSIVPVGRKELDLGQPDRIASTLDRIKPNLIVNAAAYTAVDRAEDQKELAFCVNATAPGIMARWAADHYVPLIHFSTDYVFDGAGTRPWREDDAANPLSTYGASKLAGENAVRSAGGEHLIIRTSWVYAASGQNFLRTIVRLAQERKELRIVADQVGAPTSAQLIADALADILRGPSTQFAVRPSRRNHQHRRIWRDDMVRFCRRHCRRTKITWRAASCRADRADRDRGLSQQGQTTEEFPARFEQIEEDIRN